VPRGASGGRSGHALWHTRSHPPVILCSLAAVSDDGTDPTEWTSYSLKESTYYFESPPLPLPAPPATEAVASSAHSHAHAAVALSPTASGRAHAPGRRRRLSESSAAGSGSEAASALPHERGSSSGGGKGAQAVAASLAERKLAASTAAVQQPHARGAPAAPVPGPSRGKPAPGGALAASSVSGVGGGPAAAAGGRVLLLPFERTVAVRRWELKREPALSPEGYDLYSWSEVCEPHRLTHEVLSHQVVRARTERQCHMRGSVPLSLFPSSPLTSRLPINCMLLARLLPPNPADPSP
jgi:hypothetical protein